MRRIILSLGVLVALTVPASGQEAPKDEPAPPPRVIIGPPGGNLFLPSRPIYAEHGTRDVWNNYAVDRYGRWRPRVVLAPLGSYYYSDGRPYPWTSSYPGWFRPTTQD